MAKVQLIDGRVVDAQLTNIQHVGDEGSRRAIAHIGEKTYPVYNAVIDRFNNVWVEQMSLETFKMLEGNKEVVEGSVERVDGAQEG